MRLAGKVAVIAGAGRRGIGVATARRFVEEGAKVVILDRAGRRLIEHLNKICPRSSVFIEADLTCEESLKAAIRQVEVHFHRIDILVSGIGCRPKSERVPPSDNIVKPFLSAEFIGSQLAIRTAVSSMKCSGSGVIVNFVHKSAGGGGSLLDRQSSDNFDVSNSTERVSAELGRVGIRMNSIMVDCRQSLNKANDADSPNSGNEPDRCKLKKDATRLAVFLASDGASLCTGGEFHLDGTASVRKMTASPSHV